MRISAVERDKSLSQLSQWNVFAVPDFCGSVDSDSEKEIHFKGTVENMCSSIYKVYIKLKSTKSLPLLLNSMNKFSFQN